jgi:hypothetical protein
VPCTQYRTITNKTGQFIDIGNTEYKTQNDHKQDWTIHRHWQHWAQDTERSQIKLVNLWINQFYL